MPMGLMSGAVVSMCTMPSKVHVFTFGWGRGRGLSRGGDCVYGSLGGEGL